MHITFIQNWFIQTSINYSDTSMFDICLLLRSIQVLRDVKLIMFLMCFATFNSRCLILDLNVEGLIMSFHSKGTKDHSWVTRQVLLWTIISSFCFLVLSFLEFFTFYMILKQKSVLLSGGQIASIYELS